MMTAAWAEAIVGRGQRRVSCAARMRNAGLARAAAFTWARTRARSTLDVYRQLRRQSGARDAPGT